MTRSEHVERPSRPSTWDLPRPAGWIDAARRQADGYTLGVGAAAMARASRADSRVLERRRPTQLGRDELERWLAELRPS